MEAGTSIYAFGLFIEPLEEKFNWGRTAINASLSFAAFGSIASPILGRVLDRYGVRPIMPISIALFGISFIIRPLMTQLWHFYALSSLQFISFYSVMDASSVRLVGIWFPKTRARVLGITMTGYNLGGFAMPLLIGYLLSVSSWELAYVTVGLIGFSMAVIVLLVIHENTPHLETAENTAHVESKLSGITLREATRTSTFYAIAFSTMLGVLTYNAILPQISRHMIDQGINYSTSIQLVSLLAATGIMGKISFGYMSERITARRTMMISLAGQITSIVLVVLYPSEPAVWFTIPIFGYFMGGYGVLVQLVIQECFGIKEFGSIFGVTLMFSVASTIVGPLIAGASADITGSYGTGFIIVASMFVIALLLLTKAKPIISKREI